jgi:soluble lytic murein transglycosylase-like protein
MLRIVRVIAIALSVTLVADAALADVLSTQGRAKLFSSQTRVLDSRAAEQYNSSVRLQPSRVVTPTKFGPAPSDGAIPAYRGAYKGRYADLARAAARRNGVPEDLFLRLVNQESRFDPRARSHKGAIGLAQLMPGTARELGVDAGDPVQNLDGGARYLKMMHAMFGSWRLALAAYNAGPGAVQKHGGVPPFRETRDYVRIIWGG